MIPDCVKDYIDGFDLDTNKFIELKANSFNLLAFILTGAFFHKKRSIFLDDLRRFFSRQGIEIKNINNNKIYSRDRVLKANLNIHFDPDSKGCKIYLGKNLQGSLKIRIRSSHCLVYVGDRCELKNVAITSISNDFDKIIIGNSVTTNHRAGHEIRLMSGSQAGQATPYIVIGDDCMFSEGVTIRNTDAHPIVSYLDSEQVNSPKSGVSIAPHVWIGQNATILKDVTIGCGSIVGAGAIVTKNVPPLSVALGIPASSRKLENKYWTRTNSEKSKAAAKTILEKHLKSELPQM